MTLSLFNWFGNRNASSSSRIARPKLAAKLGIETLEQRNVPATLVVNSFVDGPANPNDGMLTLREAIETINNQSTDGLSAAETRHVSGSLGVRDTILFAPTLGGRTITLTEGTLTIAKNCSIVGPGANRLTISGNDQFVGLTIDDGNADTRADVSISGATITAGRGYGDWPAGGIYSLENLSLDKVFIRDNAGPGVAVEGASVTISNSTISGNHSLIEGGGVVLLGCENATIVNSTISGNSALANGGGIWVGADCAGDKVTNVTITNCTITGNRCDSDGDDYGWGGGLRVYRGTATVNNSIIAGNFTGAGAVASDVSNTLNEANGIVQGRNNLIGDAQSSAGFVHGVNGNIVGNAGVGTIPTCTIISPILANNGGSTPTHALMSNSPAIAKGSKFVAGYSSIDQRGTPRDSATPDIGAFEAPTPILFRMPLRSPILLSPVPVFRYHAPFFSVSPVSQVFVTLVNGPCSLPTNGVINPVLHSRAPRLTLDVQPTAHAIASLFATGFQPARSPFFDLLPGVM